MIKIVWNWIKKHLSPLLFLVPTAAFLNIWNLQRLGYGNSYYAAGVKSMMTSFTNFFFLSFDTTGYISIDKAPLSLWVDTIFAKVLGFSGWAILLPHALEGVLVTILIYHIVKKLAGKWPAFLASLAITLSPVNVAVYRNNTPDALLLVYMLLAINFLMSFVKSGKWKDLILTAVMIGLGFNTKMLQAFLILPAVLVTIFLFNKLKFWQKMGRLFVFLAITAVVSFSWITIVDMTPASMRPYVGSSTGNSAWNLAFGYNGTQRLTGENGVGGTAGFNVGNKGLSRLFTGEMGTQTGWFLGSALIYSLYFVVRNWKRFWKRELEETDSLTVLAIVFLITQFVFFSYAGFFHSYYLNIFAIPIVLMVGLLSKDRNGIWFFLIASIPLQIYLITQANYATWLIPVVVSVTTGSLLLRFLLRKWKFVKWVCTPLLVGALYFTPGVWSFYTTVKGNTSQAIFIGGPSVGGSMGMGGGNGGGMGGPAGNMNTPPTKTRRTGTPPAREDGRVNTDEGRTKDGLGNGGGIGGGIDNSVLAYLKANYSGEKYFVAVGSSQQATGLILDNNIGNVMNLGGFSGRDASITLTDFKQKIAKGELRFIILDSTGMSGNGDGDGGPGNGGGRFNGNSDITTWVQENATPVSGMSNLYDLKGSV
jgi:4-amino-4-deoxy-L-arabinose transferase-like glycosyltransferase